MEWKLTAKAELNRKFYNAGKIKSVDIIRAPPWAETWTLPWILQQLRSENFWLQSTLEATRFEVWKKEVLVTVEISGLCGWWFSKQFAWCWRHFLATIWLAVSCSDLYLTCSLLEHRVGKQSYVRCDVSFLKSICVNNYFETEKSRIFQIN